MYEDWGVQSMLIAAIVALSGVNVFLYKAKESALKEHKKDLKEANEDLNELLNYLKGLADG